MLLERVGAGRKSNSIGCGHGGEECKELALDRERQLSDLVPGHDLALDDIVQRAL